ncbi:MAG: archease [Candidatus Saelkia tenebricola]|nr:archease [Candidatus Saelkia tenebricola]
MANFYKLIPHTADFGIQLAANTLSGLYINSAKALMDLIIGIEDIRLLNECCITVEGIDSNDLLVRWLNELIYIFAVKKMLFSKFEIIALSNTKLTCKGFGEMFNDKKHDIKEEIKAVTYHGLNIENTDNRYTVTIILDV